MCDHRLVYVPGDWGERFLRFDYGHTRDGELTGNSKIWNDSWQINMRQTIYKLTVDMFSEREAKFILENAERDLSNLIIQQEALIREISKNGERLSKMTEARDNLRCIVDKIKSALKEDEDDKDD